MWLRKLSTSMGCEQADFVQALKLALDDDSIAEKMSDMVTNKLKFDLNTLTDSNNELKREISKISDLNKSLQKEVSDLREIVKRKDSEIISIKTQMKSMELKLDEHEQYSRRNTLRMSGVPESPEEDTTAKVINILNKKLNLSPPISIDSIDRLHRVGKPGGSHPRHILVKFSTYRARQHVYSQKKKLRTRTHERHEPSGMPAGTTTDDDNEAEDEPNNKIYLNEDLTKRRATLLWEARKLVKDKQLKACWSFDGRIMVENNFGRIKPVNSLEDINALI